MGVVSKAKELGINVLAMPTKSNAVRILGDLDRLDRHSPSDCHAQIRKFINRKWHIRGGCIQTHPLS